MIEVNSFLIYVFPLLEFLNFLAIWEFSYKGSFLRKLTALAKPSSAAAAGHDILRGLQISIWAQTNLLTHLDVTCSSQQIWWTLAIIKPWLHFHVQGRLLFALPSQIPPSGSLRLLNSQRVFATVASSKYHREQDDPNIFCWSMGTYWLPSMF